MSQEVFLSTPHSLLTSILCTVFSQPVFSRRTSESQSQLSKLRTAGGSRVTTQRDLNSVQQFTHENLLPEEHFFPLAITRYAWVAACEAFLWTHRHASCFSESVLNYVRFETFWEYDFSVYWRKMICHL